MMRKVIFYPMYEETLVIESVSFETTEHGVDYTHHYTLKTPTAAKWPMSDLLRELSDRLDATE